MKIDRHYISVKKKLIEILYIRRNKKVDIVISSYTDG